MVPAEVAHPRQRTVCRESQNPASIISSSNKTAGQCHGRLQRASGGILDEHIAPGSHFRLAVVAEMTFFQETASRYFRRRVHLISGNITVRRSI